MTAEIVVADHLFLDHKFFHFFDQGSPSQFERIGRMTNHTVGFFQCGLNKDNFDVLQMAANINRVEIEEQIGRAHV